MDSTAIVIALGSLGGTAVLGFVGWSVKRNVDAIDTRLDSQEKTIERRLDEIIREQSKFAEKGVCELKHAHLDAEVERRSRAHHDLSNELQAVKLMLGKMDRRLAVFIATIAKDRGMQIPEDE